MFSADSLPAGVAQPARHMSWHTANWLMLADVVGTSVLTFAVVAAQLGWVLTIGFIIVLCPMSIYTAVLMTRTRNKLYSTLGVEPLTMGECARLSFGSNAAASAVYFVVYGVFAFFGNSSYLIVLGKSLQGVFYESHLCLPTAVLISCAGCLPVVIGVRRLSDSVALCFFSLFLILAVLAICLGSLMHQGRGPEVETFMFAEDIKFTGIWRAVSNVLYSFTGQWLFFEIMSEMKEPADFPKVFRINAPLQVTLYLTVAIIGYYYIGSNAHGMLLENMARGPAYRAASTILFVHVVIVFIIKNVVLARYLHGKIAPQRVDEASWRARIEYSLCGICLLIGGFVVANAVPFFDDFLSLTGGLLAGPISFLFPMAFFVGALKRVSSPNPGVEVSSVRPDQAGLLKAGEAEPILQSGGSCSAYVDAVTWVDMIMFFVIALLVAFTMGIGTYDSIMSIIEKAGNYGAPFSCLPLVD